MAYDRYDSRGGERGGWRENDRHPRDPRGGGGEHDERGFFERARDEVTSWFGDESSGGRRMEDDRHSGRDNMNWGRGGSRENERGRFEQDEHRRYGSSNRGMFGSGNEPWGRGEDHDRYGSQQSRGGMFSHDDDRDRGRFGGERHRESGGMFGGGQQPQRGGLMGGGEDRDYGQGGFGGSQRNPRDQGRDRSYPGTLGQSPHSNRDQHYGASSRRYDRDDDQYRPMTGDYGRGSPSYRSEREHRSGMGSQNFARSQYGRQDFSQDQDRDRDMGRTYNYGGWGDRDSQRENFRSSGGDDHYSQWRQRQISELDRDYDDYRREHQSKFENEFSGWRQQKQTKRQMLGSIREHMEVVDESGEHIGAVDKVHGDRIVMTRNDPAAGGVHRSFSCTLLERVDDKVHLSGNASSIRRQLHEHREDDRDSRGGGGFFSGLFGGGSSDDRSREERRDERPTSTSTNQPQGEGPHMLDRSFSGTYDDDSKK